MSIESVTSKGVPGLNVVQQRQLKVDPDGGADMAQESGSSGSTSSVVTISQQAQQLLAGSIANDSDQGRDGK